MKLLSHLKFAGIGMIVIILTSSSMCSSDDDNPSSSDVIEQAQTSITQNTWKVTNFNEDGVNHTSDFAGYNFTFNANGTVAATNGSNNMNGTWATGTDDSTPKFILGFSILNGPFEEISEDWRIEKATSTVIDLKHVSGGDGGTDILTFTKN